VNILCPATWRAAGAQVKTALTHLHEDTNAESLCPRYLVEDGCHAKNRAFSCRLIENSVRIITCDEGLVSGRTAVASITVT
jgi:predicted house-cleaning NTP pyrophosphatase (Maf/HAM1 superfamily)